MANVLFLFPPCLPTSSASPYLAPHLLSTILRQKGHDVMNMDLNVRFVNEVCNEVIAKAALEHYRQIPGHETNMPLMAAITNAEIILKKLRSKLPTSHAERIVFANILKDFFFGGNGKTVTDFGSYGFDVHPLIRAAFADMVNELDVEGRVVCISCAFGDQLPFSLELARLVRLRSPETKIIIGGAQISLLPEELILELSRFKLFNVVFTGFAEECISDVIETCPATYFEKKTEGTTATHQMLNSIPPTHFDDLELYEDPKLPVLVNKGCYWGRCTFCDYILMGDLGGARYVSRSVENVFQELKHHREQFPGMRFRLISDAVPPKFYKELCIRANQENFELKTSSYMINNKNITEEFWAEAAKAGIDLIIFGTESTNDRVLALMEKQGRRQDILTNLTHARKYQVPVKINLIPNYPTTTYLEAVGAIQDISFFDEIIQHVAVFRFYLSANTAMDRSPEDFELKVDDDVPYVKSAHNGFHSREFQIRKGMSPEEEQEAYSRAYSFAIRCDLNASIKRFNEKISKTTIDSLVFSDSYALLVSEKSPMVYSARNGNMINISTEEYDLIRDIEKKKHHMSVSEVLKERFDLLPILYAYGVISFARENLSSAANY